MLVAVSATNPGYPLPSWTVGDIYTIAGAGPGALHYGGDGSYATDAQLNSPGKVTVDTHGNALLADTGNNRVRVVAVSASNPGYLLGGCTGPCTWIRGYIYTVAGTGFAGYNGDFLPATGADLNGPTGIAVDAHGNLYVSDTNNHRLRVVAVSSSNPGFPLASWTAGDIYTIVGNSGAGYSGDGFLAASAQINGAQGVTVDTHGNPLIADTGNERVRVVAVSAFEPGVSAGRLRRFVHVGTDAHLHRGRHRHRRLQRRRHPGHQGPALLSDRRRDPRQPLHRRLGQLPGSRGPARSGGDRALRAEERDGNVAEGSGRGALAGAVVQRRVGRHRIRRDALSQVDRATGPDISIERDRLKSSPD